jgi:PDDEXK-like domain of unknown function (DUF3799)
MTYAKLLNMSPAKYHAGWGDVPHLSKSIAQILLDRSPLHAWYAHPMLGKGPQEVTQSKDNGSIVHALLLGKGSETIDVLPHDEYRTNAAKADRDASLASGRIPIKAKDYASIASAAERIRARFLDLGIDLQAPGFAAEQPIEWDEQGVHGPVRCKAMMDLVSVATGQIFDVKSIENASEDGCKRSTWNYGYYLQDAVYRSALTALTGEPSTFTLLFCELDPPQGVRPAICTGALREMGEAKWRHAVRAWEECLITKRWPGYVTDGVTRLEPPGWAVSQFLGDDSP